MRPVRALLTCLMLVTPHLAYSQQATLAGLGSLTCGQYAEWYKENPKMVEVVFFEWAQGFMSAVETVTQSLGKPTMSLLPSGFQANEQEAFMRQWCDAHPLQTFALGVLDLMEQLAAAQGYHNPLNH